MTTIMTCSGCGVFYWGKKISQTFVVNHRVGHRVAWNLSLNPYVARVCCKSARHWLTAAASNSTQITAVCFRCMQAIIIIIITYVAITVALSRKRCRGILHSQWRKVKSLKPKQKCLHSCRKARNDGVARTADGRLFHARVAATGKAWHSYRLHYTRGPTGTTVTLR